MLHAAVILCGCGRSDGSEITESVCTLIHLARHGVAYSCFAPAGVQRHVVDHLTGREESGAGVGSREMMREAARITRGNMASLAELDVRGFDMLVLPGGFGAAKNLCSFAFDGVNMTVREDVQRTIAAFYAAKKPMGFICIAPIIAAKVLGTKAIVHGRAGPGLMLTLGVDNFETNPAAAAANMFGNTHRNCATREAVTDSVNRVVTTPAYMDDAATPHDVYVGIGKCVDEVVAIARHATRVDV